MSAIKSFWPKLKWMIVTLILPEFLVGRAVQDWMLAWRYAEDRGLQEFAIKDGQEWTIVHAFYANMGGFVLRVRVQDELLFPSGTRIVGQTPSLSATTNPNMDRPSEKDSVRNIPVKAEIPIGLLSSESASAGERTSAQPKDHEKQGCQSTSKELNEAEQLLYANARQIYVLRYMRIIETLPSISRHEIESRSRGDIVVKGTAVFQVLWLVVSVTARAAQRLPVSQLEIASIAFAACTFITYGFSWYKPQDVQEPSIIGRASLNLRQLELIRNAAGQSLTRHMLGFVFEEYEDIKNTTFKPIPNDVSYRELEFKVKIGSKGQIYYNFIGTGIVLGGLIFGAIHCIAWDFDFPTKIEATLWRVASALSTCVLMLHPLAQTVQGILFMYFPLLEDVRILRRFTKFLFGIVTFLSVASYLIVRLYLMVEMLRCLFFLPPEAFVSSWPSIIPHIG